jgi:hypothetical protein
MFESINKRVDLVSLTGCSRSRTEEKERNDRRFLDEGALDGARVAGAMAFWWRRWAARVVEEVFLIVKKQSFYFVGSAHQS